MFEFFLINIIWNYFLSEYVNQFLFTHSINKNNKQTFLSAPWFCWALKPVKCTSLPVFFIITLVMVIMVAVLLFIALLLLLRINLCYNYYANETFYWLHGLNKFSGCLEWNIWAKQQQRMYISRYIHQLPSFTGLWNKTQHPACLNHLLLWLVPEIPLRLQG